MSTISSGTTSTTTLVHSGDTTGSLVFKTNDTGSGGTTAMTIDTSQNVGIGTTPNAFASSRKALQVGGSSTVATLGLSSGIGEIVYNTYYDGTNFKYINSNYAASFDFNNAATGGFAWRLASSGTAGNNVTLNEAMRIDSSGNVMIGGTGFSAKRLSSTVSSTSDVVIYAESTNASYAQAVYRSTTSTSASTSWSHFIGQSSGSTNNIFIYGNGDIKNTNNSYGAISDIKLKENITDATPKLADLMKVKVRNYTLKNNYEQHKQLGVIAQELESVFPSMVEDTIDRDTEGNDLGTITKGVKYSVFVPMLIKGLQELKALVDAQATEIAELKAKVGA